MEEEEDDEETEHTSSSSSIPSTFKSSSRPITIPLMRSRRGGFAQYSARKRVVPVVGHRGVHSDSSDADDDEMMDDDHNTLEHWVHYAYDPKASFEAALINEVVRRRLSDEELAIVGDSSEEDDEIIEMMHAEEADRRHSWMKDMSKMYPTEFGDGHLLR